MDLASFTEILTKNGYSKNMTMYGIDNMVKFIKIKSILYRKHFFLIVSHKMINKRPDHVLFPLELNYKSARQREYIGKIHLGNLICMSDANICYKSNSQYECWELDKKEPEPAYESETDEELLELEKKFGGEFNVETKSSDSEFDIKIDDFPIDYIYPIFTLEEFLKEPKTFETQILEKYNVIVSGEQAINEDQVSIIMNLFQKQQLLIKEQIFEIHKASFNITCDIKKYSDNLQKIIKLKEQSVNEKDSVKFRIDRLEAETEEKIDNLNLLLREQRNKTTLLFQKYRDYIEKFNLD
jgi:hypothetical protein